MIQGFEHSYDGVGQQANRGLKYLNPFLSTSRRVFAELNSDQAALENLIVDSSQLSGALADARARHLGPGREPEPDDERDRRPQGARSPRRSRCCPTSCATPTPPSSTCAPRSTTSTRWSTPRSRSPQSCARSSPSCAPRPPTRCRRPRPRRDRPPPGPRQRPRRAHPAPARARRRRGRLRLARLRPRPRGPRRPALAADDDFTQGAFGEAVCALDNGLPTSPSSAPTPPSWSAGSTTSATRATSTRIGGIGRIGADASTPSRRLRSRRRCPNLARAR